MDLYVVGTMGGREHQCIKRDLNAELFMAGGVGWGDPSELSSKAMYIIAPASHLSISKHFCGIEDCPPPCIYIYIYISYAPFTHSILPKIK